MYSKMDRGQTFDVVDMPPPNNQEWPSEPPPNRQEWPSLEEFSRKKIKKYRDIATGCYRLLDTFDHGVYKYGRHYFVLKLENRKGDVFQVWAPSSLVCSLKMRGRTSFIWNHGLVKCENSGKYFYSFSLC